MREFFAALLDPGTFAQRYGARGFLALLAFCAVTETAWRTIF
jgi:hypothetical protein